MAIVICPCKVGELFLEKQGTSYELTCEDLGLQDVCFEEVDNTMAVLRAHQICFERMNDLMDNLEEGFWAYLSTPKEAAA